MAQFLYFRNRYVELLPIPVDRSPKLQLCTKDLSWWNEPRKACLNLIYIFVMLVRLHNDPDAHAWEDGSSQANIHKLQRVQNVIAKLVCASNARLSDALCSLHWLPINQHIKFKLASLTFKLLQHQSPSYLASLIIPYMPSRALRSQGQQLLTKPHVKTAIESRALRVAASAVWNSLPLHVRQSPSFDSFKRNLKTYFFTSHD